MERPQMPINTPTTLREKVLIVLQNISPSSVPFHELVIKTFSKGGGSIGEIVAVLDTMIQDDEIGFVFDRKKVSTSPTDCTFFIKPHKRNTDDTL